MFIVRWLMSRPIIFVWALTIIALLLGYNMDKNHEKNAASEEVATTEHSVKSEVASTASTEQSTTPASTASTEQNTTSEQANTDTANMQATATQAAGSTKQAATAMPANTGATNTTAANQQTANTMQAVPTANNTAQTGTTNAQLDLLRLAREAYWAGNYDASISYYKKLIEAQPDNIDNKGELANVYWKKGEPQKAAELYADIAMPLIDLGKINQVKIMNTFIRQFLPERAKEIASKLQP